MNRVYVFLALLMSLVILKVVYDGTCNTKIYLTEGYENAMDSGVQSKDIPNGQEDLYILKSKVVPPVCPKCPDVINKCEGNKKPPPCPPCGRCPEPSFECKKVPNYSIVNDYSTVRPNLYSPPMN